MKVILFSIDVHKFNLFAQQQSNSETKNFLISYITSTLKMSFQMTNGVLSKQLETVFF